MMTRLALIVALIVSSAVASCAQGICIQFGPPIIVQRPPVIFVPQPVPPPPPPGFGWGPGPEIIGPPVWAAPMGGPVVHFGPRPPHHPPHHHPHQRPHPPIHVHLGR